MPREWPCLLVVCCRGGHPQRPGSDDPGCYSQKVDARTREEVAAAFEREFGRTPAFVVRAPGCVNLIGQHTGYSRLPVLSMAVEQAVLIAAVPTDAPRIAARSLAFGASATIERASPSAGASWERCLVGAIRRLEGIGPGSGAQLLVGGDLQEGGPGSSSALTVGLLAVLSAAWGEPLEGDALVRSAVAAERASGAATGGMDQESVVYAEAGAALRVDFAPPGRRTVPLPEGLAFVAAYSGETEAKGDDARARDNERVVGARIAAVMLADQIGLEVSRPPLLADVAAADVVELLVEELPEKVSPVEVAKTGLADLEQIVRLTSDRFDHMAKVPVRRVARHLLSEAARVAQAEAALRADELVAFGELLDESHNSLRQEMRVSTPALDRLCAAMRKAGAYGARLTGDGFGGFALAACPSERTAAVVEAAIATTGGPAFAVHTSQGLTLL